MRFIHRLIHMFSALLAQFPSRKGEIFLSRARVDIRSLFSHTLPSPDGRGFLVSASLFKKINVGVCSKPTLLCNHARKGIRRGRRPFSKKINVGVGSKPALLCNHARKGIHKVRSQPFFVRHIASTISFSPHPNPLPKGDGFWFRRPFLKKLM